MGVFARMREGLASECMEQKTMVIDATYPKGASQCFKPAGE